MMRARGEEEKAEVEFAEVEFAEVGFLEVGFLPEFRAATPSFKAALHREYRKRQDYLIQQVRMGFIQERLASINNTLAGF
jgi:hypothetical protein